MKAKTIDVEALEAYLQSMKDFKESEMVRSKTNAESYYSGYKDGIYTALAMLNASNYDVVMKQKEDEHGI
jgi:Ni,Fe-hydrogenase III component G